VSRQQAGYIGFNRVPAASAVNSAASGVWTLREAEAMRRAGTWPIALVSPTQITGLQLWLDASDASTLFDATTGGSLVAADGAVARWEDKSGNARHATQSTSQSRPLRKTSQQNSKDALLFDGVNDLLAVPCNLSGSSGITVFFVHKRVAASTVYAFSNYQYTPGDGAGILCSSNTSSAISAQGRPDGSASFRSTASGAATTNYVVGTARWNGASLFSYANGGSESSVSAPNETLQSANSVVFGAAYANDPFFIQPFSNISIGEIIVYNFALSDANRSAVESYLMSKWGIT